jgi:hypothetical protein
MAVTLRARMISPPFPSNGVAGQTSAAAAVGVQSFGWDPATTFYGPNAPNSPTRVYGSTSSHGVAYDVEVQDIEALKSAGWIFACYSGLAANLPPASGFQLGTLYFATDTSAVYCLMSYQNSSAAWLNIVSGANPQN